MLATSGRSLCGHPPAAGYLANRWLIWDAWSGMVHRTLPALSQALSISALSVTLVLLFALQGEQILTHPPS